MTGHERVALYLEALAKVCAEVADERRLLPVFLARAAVGARDHRGVEGRGTAAGGLSRGPHF
jgi:hypothetical protein